MIRSAARPRTITPEEIRSVPIRLRKSAREIGSQNAEARHKTLIRIGRIEKLIHLVAMFDGRNVKSFFLVAAQNVQLQYLIQAVQVERRGKPRKRFNAPIVGAKNDILHLQSRGSGGAVRASHPQQMTPQCCASLSPSARVESNLLSHRANLHAVNVSIFAQAVIDKIHDARRDGETQPFAAPSG